VTTLTTVSQVTSAVKGAIVFTVAYVAWVAAGPSGRVGYLVDRLAVVAVSLAAAALCSSAAKAAPDARVRRGWNLFAVTGVCWALFNLVPAGLAVFHRDDGAVHWVSDAAALVGAVLPVIAVLDFLGSSLSSAARMRRLVDGLLMGASLLFVAWTSVLERTYLSAGDSPTRFLSLAYPLADIVLMALVLVVVVHARHEQRLAWILMASGCACVALAHGAFAYLQLSQAWYPGSPETFGWLVGGLLVAMAAHFSRGGRPLSPAGEVEVGGPLSVWLPFIPVALAAVAAVPRLSGGRVSSFVLANCGVIVVLLVARQVLAQLDNIELARDLEARVRDRTRQLDLQQRHFRALAQNASDVLTVIDANGIVRYQSESVERVLGYQPDELVGLPVSSLFDPDERDVLLTRLGAAIDPADPPVVECRMRRSDGTWCTSETTIANLLHEEAVRGILLTSRDIGERKRFEEELRQQALIDPLTRLANRSVLRDRLRHAIARASRSPQNLALMILDLDGFKQVNDSLGHEAGDRLLVEVGDRLRQSVRPGDTVARLGGDEFAILLEGATPGMAEQVARRIVGRLRAPVTVGGKSIVVAGSVGIAAASTAETSAEDLLRNADLAMYEAKAKGKNRVEQFKPAMQAAALARLELETDLRRAVHRRELTLDFQPIVDVSSGRIAGVEALVRWRHRDRGPISPAEFVQLAEESDLALSLGSWVMREACHYGRRFQELYPTQPPLTVSINLSSRQLYSEHIVSDVATILSETGIDPQTVILEITEGALMDDDRDVMSTLSGLRQLGVRLAIDDFGTGWSSLSRLREFPVDELKIDKSFVAEVHDNADEAPIIAAIVAMAHSLSLSVVAEGVETLDQLACLNQYGCDYVQGYLLSRPLPPEMLERLLVEPRGLLEPAVADDERSELMQMVQDVVSGVPDNLSQLVQSMLAELCRVSGADSVYLTVTDWTDLSEEIRFLRNEGVYRLADRTRLSWIGSPAAVMAADGRHLVRDLRDDFPQHELSRLGVITWVGVPVTDDERHLVGTLCAVGHQAGQLSESTAVLLDLFSRMLVEHLGAAPGGHRPLASLGG